MDIEFDAVKRADCLKHRGLDFAEADLVFAGEHVSRLDDRRDYGEERVITAGLLRGRFVILVWTWRGHARRIISMRYGHDDERSGWERSCWRGRLD